MSSPAATPRDSSAAPSGRRSFRPWRGRFALIALFVLFFAPVLTAIWLNVSVPDWRPFGMRNHGELIQPSVQINTVDLTILSRPDGATADLTFQGIWSLVLVSREACDEACRTLLAAARQARWGLDKDMDRVQRLLVLPADEAVSAAAVRRLGEDFPRLQIASASRPWLEGLPATAPAHEASGSSSDTVSDGSFLLLVDPQGYLVTRYRADADVRGIIKDLERLLHISKIG